MAKILVSDSLSEQGLAVLEQAEGIELVYRPGLKEDDLAKEIVGVDGLVIRSGSRVTAKVLAAADRLKVIGRAGIGVDNVDVPEASRRGVIVMNTPTGNATTTAEHAISLLFSIARKIPQAAATMREGKWEKKLFEGRELTGKTLGVVGLGNIGRIVAERGHGLRMSVIGFDPVVSPERAAELGVELVDLDTLFRRADAISVHTPLNEHTRGLVNRAAVEKMKPGVLLVNAARGGIFEDEALLEGLESGKIGGVAVDVFVEEPPGLTPLIQHPNVVATPHLGASTEEAQLRVAVEIAEQVVAYLTAGEIVNSVNVPSVPREMAPVLGPYQALAARLGEYLGQVESISPECITIEYGGDATQISVAPVTNAALSGLLAQFLEGPINAVNAPLVAKDRGIEIKELKTTKKGAFSTTIALEVRGREGTARAVGTLAADSSPRLLTWGDFEIDAHLDGEILIIQNEDRPGVIGAIGSILGAAEINISRMQVGLKQGTRDAVAFWALEKSLPEGVLDSLRAAKDVKHAMTVKIGR